MDDLDIEYRIAKIDGVQCQIEQADTTHAYLYSEDLNSEYHPLTDDALCFQLMVKYRIEVFPIGKTFWCAWDSINLDTRTNHDNLNKAICLAIIKVNKGE